MKQANENLELKLLFSEFATKFGKQYLASGGPTARLELSLTRLAKHMNLKAEVFATPTGVFVNTMSRNDAVPMTSLRRIKSKSINLQQVVKLESILEELSQHRITFPQALEKIKYNPKKLPKHIYYSAIFLSGIACSFPQFAIWQAALASGLLTSMVAWISGPFSRRLQVSQIFTDFFGCFVALLLSGILSQWLNIPVASVAIGTLVYLVPGLTLTIAISELAEQNFVAGTAEMMKGILILLAMGTAYLLAKDLMNFISPQIINQMDFSRKDMISFWPKFFGNIALSFAFSITFRVPKPMIILGIIVGTISWSILQTFQGSNYFILGSYLPAFSVGTLSLLFGRVLKVPSQVFSVPGIFSLLPGLLVFSSFYNFSSGMPDKITEVFFQGAMIASSITFGLLSARLPFQIMGKLTEREME